MKTEFLTTEYQFSHGHTPRGRGSWAFEVECNTQLQFDSLLDPAGHGVVRANATDKSGEVQIWTRGSTTYSEAKAQVSLFLRPHFTSLVINVCP